MIRRFENDTNDHLWAALLASTVTEVEDDLIEHQVIEAHYRFDALNKRIAELESRLIGAIYFIPDDISCGDLRKAGRKIQIELHERIAKLESTAGVPG